MKRQLEELLTHPAIWTAAQQRCVRPVISTGFSELDEQLHDSGWPAQATTELLSEQCGIGELRLLIPALRTVQKQKPWIVFIAPPYLPYAPALVSQGIDIERILIISPRNDREMLWSTEQALRSGSCSAVLNWSGRSHISNNDRRRMQQAAAYGNCMHILFATHDNTSQHSPAALRMILNSSADGMLHTHIIKQRGGWAEQKCILRFTPDLTENRMFSTQALPVHQNHASSVAKPASTWYLNKLDYTKQSTHTRNTQPSNNVVSLLRH